LSVITATLLVAADRHVAVAHGRHRIVVGGHWQTGAMHEDPYLWLEDVTGSDALDWVRARNAESTAVLAGTPEFDARKADLLSALDADDRIPYVRRRGEYLYNFWQDAQHPRGLWRRTTPES
jgi:prolyl oligopeptidase